MPGWVQARDRGRRPCPPVAPTMSISLVREFTRSETEERGSVLRSDSSFCVCPGTGAVFTALPPAGNLGKEKQRPRAGPGRPRGDARSLGCPGGPDPGRAGLRRCRPPTAACGHPWRCQPGASAQVSPSRPAQRAHRQPSKAQPPPPATSWPQGSSPAPPALAAPTQCWLCGRAPALCAAAQCLADNHPLSGHR